VGSNVKTPLIQLVPGIPIPWSSWPPLIRSEVRTAGLNLRCLRYPPFVELFPQVSLSGRQHKLFRRTRRRLASIEGWLSIGPLDDRQMRAAVNQSADESPSNLPEVERAEFPLVKRSAIEDSK